MRRFRAGGGSARKTDVIAIKTILPLLIQISLYAIVVSVGLCARWQDLIAPFQRPGLFARAIVAVNLVVPAVALVMVLLLPIEPIVKAGIFAMALSPPTPNASRKLLSMGTDASRAVGFYVGLMLVAMVLIPATSTIVAQLIPRAPTISVSAASSIVIPLLVPLAAGIAFAALVPGWAPRLASLTNVFGLAGLALVAILVVARSATQLLSLLGDGTLLAITVTIAAGLAAGHWLGGPQEADRNTLALTAAARHPAFAVLMVRLNYDDKRALFAILLFLLAHMTGSALYTALIKRAKAAR